MKLTIELDYLTPSLNVTKRQHWAQQYREKQKAYSALVSALSAIGSDPLIRIISPEASRMYLMAYDTLLCSKAMNRGVSRSKPSKSKSASAPSKKP